jgi:hypothetical protein
MGLQTLRYARDLFPEIDSLATRRRETFPEIEDEIFWEFYDKCKDYSLVHITGFYNVFQSFNYIAANRLKGCAVECGCFLGGIAMFMGLLRKRLNLKDMEIILYDTFNGPPVGSIDTMFGSVVETTSLLPDYRETISNSIKETVGSTEDYRFIEGLVEDTLPKTKTGDIALLRLDTDYYSSTAMEFKILYPKLVPGGVLIVDDYGIFQGARRATDEYLKGLDNPPLLNRIDTGVWAGVKPCERRWWAKFFR